MTSASGTDTRRVALITGASSGFGLLTAVELAQRGLRVVASMRDLSRADRLDAALAGAGLSADKVRLDVTDQASIDAAVAEVGRVDVLVNNAGYGIAGAIEDVSMAELRAQFETNFFGLVALTKAVLPGMRERRWGRVINVSSLNGVLGVPMLGAYCASKHAVEGLTESMRVELLPFGVYVTLVEPGTFRTDIFTRNKVVAAAATDPGSPYYERMQKGDAFAMRRVENSSADPRAVAVAIARAATANRPALRYPVGVDARGLAAAKRALPYRVLEAAMSRLVG